MKTDAQRAKEREQYALNRDSICARKRAAYKRKQAHYISPEFRSKRRSYYAATIERRRELDRLRYRRHRQKRLDQNRLYRLQNKDKLAQLKAARWKVNYARDKEKLQYKNRLDYSKHHAKRRQYFNQWSRKNRDKMRLAEHKYFSKHPELRTLKNNRRRLRKIGAGSDSNAEAFIKYVRSQRTIPCYYCGKLIHGKLAHIDHIVALSKSGNHSSSNLCASCEFCNCSKCDRSLSQWIPPTGQIMLNL